MKTATDIATEIGFYDDPKNDDLLSCVVVESLRAGVPGNLRDITPDHVALRKVDRLAMRLVDDGVLAFDEDSDTWALAE